jgi:hypothetical protein
MIVFLGKEKVLKNECRFDIDAAEDSLCGSLYGLSK